MEDSAMDRLFDQLKDWISFADSLWTVGGAIVLVAVFFMRRIRRERQVASEAIRGYSVKLSEVGELVRNLETENTRLADELNAMARRDFESVRQQAGFADSIARQHEANDLFKKCFDLNADALTFASIQIARVHLEGYHVNGAADHIGQARRFADIALLVSPESKLAKTLRAEVLVMAASIRAAPADHRRTEQLWDEALSLCQSKPGRPATPQDYARLLETGTRLRQAGLYEQAGAALRAGYRASLSAFGEDSPVTLTALNNVATNYSDRNLPAEARPLHAELADRYEQLAGHVDEDAYRHRIAVAACDRKLHGEAAALDSFQRLIADGEGRFGADNRWVLKARNSLAVCLSGVGRDEDAEEVYRDVIKRESRLLGDDHVNTLATRTNLAVLLEKTGRTEEAHDMLVDILSRHERVLGVDHPMTQQTLKLLEVVLRPKLHDPLDGSSRMVESSQQPHPNSAHASPPQATTTGQTETKPRV
jgi:hypothetical protein